MRKEKMKIVVIILVALVAGVIVYGLLWGNTRVVRVSHYRPTPRELRKGDIVAPFQDFDFRQGQWKAVLTIDVNDYGKIDGKIPEARCLETSDRNVLQEMQKTWRFVVEGGDLATVTSAILIFRDGKLVFESGIVLESGNEGLQSPEFGWVIPTQKNVMLESCSQFKAVRSPVVFY